MSNETKWTPGPWKHTLRNANEIMTTFHGVQIGRIYIDVTTDNEQEDSRLIAAAPELYEALDEATKDLVAAQVNARRAAKRDAAWEGVAELIQLSIDRARAALAKARGE